MTPEEKSQELIKKFSSVQQWVGGEGFISAGSKLGKQCAIICVEQIISAAKAIDREFDNWHDVSMSPETYWEEVLECIKNS